MMDRPIKKRKWLRNLVYTILFIGIITSAGIYYFFYYDSRSKLNVDSRKIIISTVENNSFQEFIPVLGKVQPVTTVYLDAIEGGRVEKIFVEAGAWVEEGDEILLLSNTNLVLNLMQREAEYYNLSDNLQKSRLSLEQNRLNFITSLNDLDYQIQTEKRQCDENRPLYEKDLISKSKFEPMEEKYEYLVEKRKLAIQNHKQETQLREVQIEQFEASLKRMESNLDIVKDKLDKLTIRAPITGQLTTLNAEIGESKAPGQRLGQVNVLEDLQVNVKIDEHYIDRIEEGKTGTFEFSGETAELVIIKIYPDVKEEQFEVEMRFADKPAEGIRIGQTLHIKLALGNLSEAVTIPGGGFYKSTAGQWVYVLDETGEFATKRDIRLGRKNPNFIEVLDGLKPGEKVITSSYDNFENIDVLILR